MTHSSEFNAPKPVKVDMTYLCPKDPNRKKIVDAGGVVMPEDGPTHLGGYFTKIEFVPEDKQTFMPDGRPYQFKNQRKVGTWKCSTCGSEINLDPLKI